MAKGDSGHLFCENLIWQYLVARSNECDKCFHLLVVNSIVSGEPFNLDSYSNEFQISLLLYSIICHRHYYLYSSIMEEFKFHISHLSWYIYCYRWIFLSYIFVNLFINWIALYIKQMISFSHYVVKFSFHIYYIIDRWTMHFNEVIFVCLCRWI